jgi:hypothetical protein
MHRILLSLVFLIACAAPAFAYDECGGVPEPPTLPPGPAPATEDFVRELQGYDRDFGLDTEGHLTCLQLAESDVNNDPAIPPARKEALVTRFWEDAAKTRGNRSHWRDMFSAWLEAWSRARGKPVPPPPQD